jgi:hypothetical protein
MSLTALGRAMPDDVPLPESFLAPIKKLDRAALPRVFTIPAEFLILSRS